MLTTANDWGFWNWAKLADNLRFGGAWKCNTEICETNTFTQSIIFLRKNNKKHLKIIEKKFTEKKIKEEIN